MIVRTRRLSASWTGVNLPDMSRYRAFHGRQAVASGALSARRLQKDFRALYRNVYVPRQSEVDARLRAHAAWLWAHGDCTLVGRSAAALHGAKWIDPDAPAELHRVDRHAPNGIVIRSYALDDDETCLVDGMRTTTPARTAFDLGRLLPLADAVIHLDALARATSVDAPAILEVADRHANTRGVRRMRTAVGVMDGGAESPQETRLRLVLVGARLPVPETQIAFRDRHGIVRVRVDMGWRRWKVAVEYDGVQHWTDRRQRAWDIDRIALLEASGWVVIRVSAELLGRPDVVIWRVREKLRARGCLV